MRVLHLPYSVANHAPLLVQAERSAGLESEMLLLGSEQVGSHGRSLGIPQHRSALGKLNVLVREFLKVRSAYDVFHFNFGSSLIHFPGRGLNQAEVPFYPRGAKLFVTFQGCDARQKYPTMRRTQTAPCHNQQCYNGVCNSGVQDRYRREGIAKLAQYVEHMWALNPDLLWFLPREQASFLPYLGNPAILPAGPVGEGATIKIVHAPTDPIIKGTPLILAAMDSLKKKYPGRFELILVQGKPHAEALQIYAEADLVIDQVLQGYYGGTAVEVMRMGKPVLARLSREDFQFVPGAMAEDAFETFIDPEVNQIEEVLERCILDRRFLQDRARKSLDYVNRWHDPAYVASLTKAAYEA